MKKEVIILGIGPSRVDCPFDAEVWAVARVLNFDGLGDRTYSKVFAFDPRNTPALKEPLDIALAKGLPVVSTKAYATENYPLEEITKTFGVTFFKNTICYMIAYAIYKGYKKIRLYGVDQGPEWDYIAGRPYVLFWIGYAAGRGIKIEQAPSSLLANVLRQNIKKRFQELKNNKEFDQIVWADATPVFVRGNSVQVKVTGSGYKPTFRRKFSWRRFKEDSLARLILTCLYAVKPFRTIKLCHIRSIAIGQQAGNTGLFLRRLQLAHSNHTTYIGISGKPDNQQLLKMFKRKLPIIQSDYLAKLQMNPILHKSPFYQELPLPHNCYGEFRNTKPDIEFTAEEEEKGRELLRKMGIGGNDWFVCFHSRDNAFMATQDRSRQYSSEFRDSDIDNYMEAAQYITEQGGYAIRVGYRVEKPLKTHNQKIIDYASNYRTDFGDIYLLAKCKFFLGNTSGLWTVATIFNTPVACANFIPFHTPYREGDLFIPKRIKDNTKKRVLTMREYIDFCDNTRDVSNVMMLNKLLMGDYEIIENTSQEILALCQEMNERLDGTWQGSDKAQELLTQSDFFYGTPARIGTEFMKNSSIPEQNYGKRNLVKV